jgi:hypothetical protein
MSNYAHNFADPVARGSSEFSGPVASGIGSGGSVVRLVSDKVSSGLIRL